MSIEENKELLLHAIERANAGDYDVWDLMEDDCEIVDQTGAQRTKADFKAEMDAFLNAFPDFHVEVEDVIAEHDRVVARYTETGTWKEAFAGMEPTGQEMSYPAIEIWRLADGRITGMWMARDLLTAFTQLGAIPPMQ